jgi:glycerophosphoryl diester phosphodiesterase
MLIRSPVCKTDVNNARPLGGKRILSRIGSQLPRCGGGADDDPQGLTDGYAAAGNQVWVWTVDEPTDVEFVLSLLPEAIITNRPRDVLRARTP